MEDGCRTQLQKSTNILGRFYSGCKCSRKFIPVFRASCAHLRYVDAFISFKIQMRRFVCSAFHQSNMEKYRVFLFRNSKLWSESHYDRDCIDDSY